MKFLSSNMENQIVFDVSVKGEITQPITNIKGKVTLNGTLLETVDIIKNEGTTYTLNLPEIDVSQGEVKNLRVQLQSNTYIGVFNYNKVYYLINYENLTADYDSIRAKLGVLEHEIYDEELTLETTYINSYKVFKPKFFSDLILKPNLSFLYTQYLIVVSAINTLPKLAIRIAKKDATENGDFTRLATSKDLENLLENLEKELQGIIDDLTEYVDEVNYGLPIFEFVTIRPDLVTGV